MLFRRYTLVCLIGAVCLLGKSTVIAQNACANTTITIENSSGTTISAIDFVGVKYNYPAPNQSCWFYKARDLAPPAISHLVFGVASDCYPSDDFKNDVGIWEGTFENPSLLVGQGSPFLVDPDPRTGVSGLKFDLGFNNFEERGYYFTTNNNYGIGQNFTYATKEGNIIGLVGVCGPDKLKIVPVELVKFDALKQTSGILLTWETASELDNQGFEVERSKDGQDWQRLHFVKGYGTTMTMQQYKWKDNAPKQGINYYRLKQLDLDGGFEYSKIIVVDYSTKDFILEVFPNPTYSFIYYQVEETTTIESVQLFDMTGRLVKSFAQKDDRLSLGNVKNGLYILRVKTAAGRLQQMISKQ